jgi:outer membrane lipoprotein-sorting protein
MLKRAGKKFVVVPAAILLLLTCQTARAYILRGPHILDITTRKLAGISSMLVTQHVQFFDSEKSGPQRAEETLRYLFPETFRSDARSEASQRIYLLVRGRSITIINNKRVDTDAMVFDRYKDILLYRSRDRLDDCLRDLGVDMSVVAYGRFEDKIAFVIGAEKPDDPGPQLWIDKETFLPMRWLMKTEGTAPVSRRMEIRYADWRRIDQAWYPMQVTYLQDGEPVRQITVDTLKTNLNFPRELFDIDSLKEKYAALVPEENDGPVARDVNEIEKSIDEFRKKYE